MVARVQFAEVSGLTSQATKTSLETMPTRNGFIDSFIPLLEIAVGNLESLGVCSDCVAGVIDGLAVESAMCGNGVSVGVAHQQRHAVAVQGHQVDVAHGGDRYIVVGGSVYSHVAHIVVWRNGDRLCLQTQHACCCSQ